jgi:hypothetical protein
MHARRFACFFLGLWLAGGLFMAYVATQNFRGVDRLLSGDNPAAGLRLKPLGPQARMILRYQASEMNRWLFGAWETTQLVCGAVFFVIMLFGSRENKFVLAGILLGLGLVLLQHLVLTPELIALGRLIDFVPPNAPSPDRRQFWVLHNAYSGIEVGKWLVALVLAGKMVFFSGDRTGHSRHTRRELDGIDKADYRRVNW